MCGDHSHAVTGVVNAGSYVVDVLCFRLRRIASLFSVGGWLEEQPHLPGGGGANSTTFHIGTCPQTLLWLRGGSGRDMPKTLLQPTKNG